MDLVRSEIEQLKHELIQRLAQAGIGIGLLLAAVTVLFLALFAAAYRLDRRSRPAPAAD